MKKLSTTPISSTALFPVKKGTLDFLQLAYQEAITALVNNTIGVAYYAGTPYILYGLNSYISGGNTVIPGGAIFYNEEVFLFGGQVIPTPAGPNVIVCNLSVTQYTSFADPVTFTDASVHNVHDIRRITFTTGLPGSGNIADFSAFIGAYPPFITIGLTIDPNWANTGSPLYDLAYKVDGNEVSLRGEIRTASIPNPTTLLFTLPAIAAPLMEVKIPFNLYGTSIEQTYLQILPNGQASCITALTGTVIANLDNIRFSIR